LVGFFNKADDDDRVFLNGLFVLADILV